MANHSNSNSDSSGETPLVTLVIVLAAVVGILLLVQLVRAHAPDLFSMLIIAACFVVGVIGAAMWSNRSGG